MHAWCLQRSKKRAESPGSRITDVCELQYRCQNSNLGPLEEHEMPLTTEPSFQASTFWVLRQGLAMKPRVSAFTTQTVGHYKTQPFHSI